MGFPGIIAIAPVSRINFSHALGARRGERHNDVKPSLASAKNVMMYTRSVGPRRAMTGGVSWLLLVYRPSTMLLKQS